MSKFWNDLRRNAPGEPGGGNPAPAPSPVVGGDPATPPAPATAAGADFSFIPADFHVDGKPDIGKFTAHYQDLVAADAQRQQALADVPEDGVYDFALPADLKFEGLELPDGFTIELAKDDPTLKPLFDELGGVLKEFGLPRAAAGKFAALVAKYDAVRYSQAFASVKAELAGLGTPTQQQARIGAVQRKLETMLPPDQVEALKGLSQSAKAVMALEQILSPSSPSTPTPQPTNPNIEGMTPYQRLQQANAQARRA